MPEMNDVGKAIDAATENALRSVCEQQAARLRQYIQYEFSLINSEVTFNTGKHGYSFKTMPEQIVENMQIDVRKDLDDYVLSFNLDSQACIGIEDSIIELFKDYVLENSMNKLMANMKG